MRGQTVGGQWVLCKGCCAHSLTFLLALPIAHSHADVMFENCLVIGDSCMKHLNRYHQMRFPSGRYWVHGAPVSVLGLSGGHVTDTGYYLANLARRIVGRTVACGSNDLCNTARTADVFADDLMSLARFLVQRCGVDRVVLCELLPRVKTTQLFQVHLTEFNRRVCQTNAVLAQQCSSLPFPVQFWKHDYRVLLPRSLAEDAAHLNENGLKQLHLSVNRAIWVQLRNVLPI
jgi:hypothetical protein